MNCEGHIILRINVNEINTILTLISVEKPTRIRELATAPIIWLGESIRDEELSVNIMLPKSAHVRSTSDYSIQDIPIFMIAPVKFITVRAVAVFWLAYMLIC